MVQIKSYVTSCISQHYFCFLMFSFHCCRGVLSKSFCPCIGRCNWNVKLPHVLHLGILAELHSGIHVHRLHVLIYSQCSSPMQTPKTKQLLNHVPEIHTLIPSLVSCWVTAQWGGGYLSWDRNAAAPGRPGRFFPTPPVSSPSRTSSFSAGLPVKLRAHERYGCIPASP